MRGSYTRPKRKPSKDKDGGGGGGEKKKKKIKGGGGGGMGGGGWGGGGGRERRAMSDVSCGCGENLGEGFGELGVEWKQSGSRTEV